MNKYLNYAKFLGIFCLCEIFVAFLMSLLNIIGLNTSITTIIILILNIGLFFYFSYSFGLKTKKKGYICGLLVGFALIITLFLINIIFYKQTFNINNYLYYLILLLTSIVASVTGKIKKKED